MPRTAVLFAGQGSLDPANARSLYEASASVRARVDETLSALELTVERALSPDGRALRDTRVLQPVLVALQLGVLDELDRAGLTYSHAAGHSVGELSAWAAAGVFSASSVAGLARSRGAAMAECARRAPGQMVALTRVSESEMLAALTAAERAGVAVMAVHNARDEWVLAGDRAAMRAAMRAPGAVMLDVSGAWHSPLMEQAAAVVEQAVATLDEHSARAVTVVSCVTGAVADASHARSLVAAGVCGPVRWLDVLQTLERERVERFVIAGPGRVLRGLLRRELGAREVALIDDGPSLIELTNTR
ncbi:MAG: ACP S-malonyltransferase [Polyangiales bacterium]